MLLRGDDAGELCLLDTFGASDDNKDCLSLEVAGSNAQTSHLSNVALDRLFEVDDDRRSIALTVPNFVFTWDLGFLVIPVNLSPLVMSQPPRSHGMSRT